MAVGVRRAHRSDASTLLNLVRALADTRSCDPPTEEAQARRSVTRGRRPGRRDAQRGLRKRTIRQRTNILQWDMPSPSSPIRDPCPPHPLH